MYLFFIFFIISGFCSLVYQVVWLRIAMADFGVTSTMISIVLAVFMAGLSIGSWGGGRLAAGLRTGKTGYRLRRYAAVEAVIGLSGLVSVPILNHGRDLVTGSSLFSWGSGSYYLVSGLAVFLALFPFCVCMGATFPLAMAALKRAYPDRSATSFSYLYLANLLGAVAGCTGTAFVMIELLGFRGSMFFAVVLNFAVALAAFVMSRSTREEAISADSDDYEHCGKVTAPATDRRLYAVLVVTGLTSMALEVVWTRQFTVFLGPVVYTFASILVLFLIANYAGSSMYRKIRRHSLLAHGNLLLALLTATAGFTALLTLLTADTRLPFSDGIAGGVLRVAAGVVPFGLVLGFITPWVVDRISNGEPDRAGTAYSLNTVGCIFGPLVAGFVLLPLVGERWSILALTCLLFLLSPLLLQDVKLERSSRLFSGAAVRGFLVAVAVLSLLLVVLTDGYETRYPGAVVLRDHTATVVAAGTGWKRQLLVNGYGMTELTPITKAMVHLPMAFHATAPANGLVLCFGMGTSFRSMLSWGVPTTVVELVPSIPGLFGYYHHDAENLVTDVNARIVIDDARRYLSRTAEKYDVIVVDPPPPIEAAASSLLYSVEFYRSVAGRLSPGGVFQQWTDSNDPYLISAITRSLTAVFPYVRPFKSFEGRGLHYIASLQPFQGITAAELAARLPARAAADLVEWGPFITPVEQFNSLLIQEHDVRQLVQAVPTARAIEDDRPVNEYYLFRRLSRWLIHG